MGTGGSPSATLAQSPSLHAHTWPQQHRDKGQPSSGSPGGRRAGGFAPHLQGFLKQHLKMRSKQTCPGPGWALPSFSIRVPSIFMELLLSPHSILLTSSGSRSRAWLGENGAGEGISSPFYRRRNWGSQGWGLSLEAEPELKPRSVCLHSPCPLLVCPGPEWKPAQVRGVRVR